MNSDYSWILNSPSLMSIATEQSALSWFSDILHTHEDMIQPPEITQHRLGLYYEDLVYQLIGSSRRLIDLKRNVKVFDGRITKGEFDFIGNTDLGGFHLECAIKFYLRTESGSELHHFIGPGKKDRLDLKWERMNSHQLMLSSDPLGIQACEAQGVYPKLKLLLIQGYLFHPFGEGSPNVLHQAINPFHAQGWWLKHHQLGRLKHDGFYVVMIKPRWLTPDTSTRMNLAQLTELVVGLNNPVLICRVDRQGGEIDRGFVVPDSW